jgi:hypothetical protein
MQVIRATEDKIVLYYTSPKQGEKLKDNKKGKKITEDNRTKGVLSQKAKSRMMNCISKMVQAYTVGKYANKWRFFTRKISLNFVTLTLPAEQIHTDKEIKRVALDKFLQILIKKYGVTTYVWRAEKQKNGNIHFHILINRNIHYTAIRAEWNRCIELLGYVSRYQEKFSKMSLSDYIKHRKPKTNEETQRVILSYNKQCSVNWSSPNSTDIHKIDKMHKISAYISKYMTKSEKGENLKVEGHLWGRSDNLEELPNFEAVAGVGDLKKLERIKNTSHCIYYREEFFEVYTLVDIDIFDLSLSFTSKYLAQMQINYCKLEGIIQSASKLELV